MYAQESQLPGTSEDMVAPSIGFQLKMQLQGGILRSNVSIGNGGISLYRN